MILNHYLGDSDLIHLKLNDFDFICKSIFDVWFAN